MRAEPWMNRKPAKRKSDLEIAEADVRHWLSRVKELNEMLSECECSLSKALERRDELERRASS